MIGHPHISFSFILHHGCNTSRLQGFFDELAAALVGQLGSLTSAELVTLVPATASMPSTQRGLLLRRLARELAVKVG